MVTLFHQALSGLDVPMRNYWHSNLDKFKSFLFQCWPHRSCQKVSVKISTEHTLKVELPQGQMPEAGTSFLSSVRVEKLVRFTRARASSVQFSRSVMSNSLQPHESQHARPPCLSPTPGVHPNSGPLSL